MEISLVSKHVIIVKESSLAGIIKLSFKASKTCCDNNYSDYGNCILFMCLIACTAKLKLLMVWNQES